MTDFILKKKEKVNFPLLTQNTAVFQYEYNILLSTVCCECLVLPNKDRQQLEI